MTTTQIAEYSETEAALATLREKYEAAVYDVRSTKGMKEAREARAELKGYRVSLEKKRQEIKAPALERCRLIDAEAKRITAELVALEDPIDSLIKAEEERKAAEKAAAEEAERQRVAAIQARINRIRDIPAQLAGRTSAEIESNRLALQSREITLDDYAELTGEALQAKEQTLEKLAELHEAALAHEAEQARIQAERAELEKLRAEAAERDRLAAEERAQAEAKLRAEREAAEAEQRRIAQEQAAAQAEIDRQRRELEEREAAAERGRQAEAAAKERERVVLEQRKAREEFHKNGPSAEEVVQLVADHFLVEREVAQRWLSRLSFKQAKAA